MEATNDQIQAISPSDLPVLRSWVGLGSRFGRGLVTTGFTAARDVHGEWKMRVKDVFDIVESTQRGMTSLARRLYGHLDTVIEDALKISEEGALTVVSSISTTADDATRIAAEAGSTWVGSRERAV